MAIGSVHNMVSRILMFPFVLFIWRGTFSPVHVTPLLGPPPQNPKTTLPAAAGFGTPHDLLHMAHESLPKARTMMQPKKKLASYSYFQPWDGMEGWRVVKIFHSQIICFMKLFIQPIYVIYCNKECEYAGFSF